MPLIMKCVLILALICVAVAYEHQEQSKHERIEKFRNELQESLKKFVQAHKRGEPQVEDVNVVLNEFVDKLFGNLKTYLTSQNLNTIPLPDVTLDLDPAGHMSLSSGSLQDLTTLSRSGDTVLTYLNNEKKTVLVLPFQFDDLKFNYHYHTKVTLISISGGLEGEIKSCQFHTQLNFDFKTYAFFLDHLDMKHTGDITIKFTGNKIIDWLSNAMSKAVTTVLHPLIVGEVQKLLRNELRQLIEVINEEIAKILTPPTAAYM